MSVFPHDDETQVGKTPEIAEEEKIYEASEDTDDAENASEPGDHAYGGSEGTADGT